MKRTIIAAAAAVLAIGLALAIVTPVSASTSAQARRVRYDMLFPGQNHFFAKPQTPPLLPLLRFYMVEHTNTYPRSWKATFCLHKWRFNLLKARWEQHKVFPCAHLTKADLATPGESVTWHLGDQPYPDWYCKPGRYFVSWGDHAVSSTGVEQHTLQFSPFHEGSRIPGEDWGRRLPTRKESHKQANCKKM